MRAQSVPASAALGPESAFSWAAQEVIRPHLQCELLTSLECLPCVASPGRQVPVLLGRPRQRALNHTQDVTGAHDNRCQQTGVPVCCVLLME